MSIRAVNAAGISRIVVGIIFFIAPKFLLELTDESRGDAAPNLAMRARGVRDVALGAGIIASSRSDSVTDLRRWLLAALGCDAVDSATGAVSFRSAASPESVMVTGAALGFVALDRWALRSTHDALTYQARPEDA
jgi:hypothetical protein